LKVLTEVVNVFILRIQLPDHIFFLSRSFYSVSQQWSLILKVLTEVAKVYFHILIHACATIMLHVRQYIYVYIYAYTIS